ncbi:hypothetical protein EMCRGX_G001626 [Ephydatia muelleri]
MLISMTLVLQKLVSSLDADEECAEILLQAWYLDNGALAGTRSAVLCALHLIEELGPALGLHVNLAKCEMFSRRGNTSFLPEAYCKAECSTKSPSDSPTSNSSNYSPHLRSSQC